MKERKEVDQRLLGWLTPVLILGLSFAVFHRTSPGGFLSDDFTFLQSVITLNASNFLEKVLIPKVSWGFYRPVGILYWWLCYKMFGLDPFGYWVLSVLMHALNGYLVFIVLSRLKLGFQGAIAGALIFSVFPLHGEAVAWMSCAFERLCLLFVLAGIYFYTSYREHGRPAYYVLTLISFVLALLSKEMAITFPALVFIADLAMADGKRRDVKGALVRILPVAAVAAVYLSMRFAVFHGFGGYTNSRGEAIQTSLNVGVITYNLFAVPGKVLFPINTVLLKDASVVYGFLAAVIVSSVIFRLATGGPSGRYAVLGVAWLAVAYLPAMTLYAIFPNLMDGRFSYIPSVGLAIVGGSIFGLKSGAGRRWNSVRLGLLAVFVCCYVYISYLNYATWPIAYRIAEFLPREVVRMVPNPPKGSDMYFIGPYDNFDGAYIYRNGLQQAINIEYGPGGGRHVKVHFIGNNGNAKDDPSVTYEALSKSERDNLFIFNFKPRSGKLIPEYPPETAQAADKPDAEP